MKRILLLTALFLLVICIPLTAKTSATKQLAANLEKWQSFRCEGIIQVQSDVFALRKNFVLAKNAEAIRLDVLDGGVMGLGAAPLVSLYLKDTAVLSAPTIEQLQGIDLNWFLPAGAVQKLVHFTDSLLVSKKEITSTRKLSQGNTDYTFDRKYRLASIDSKGMGMKAVITYNNSDQPTKINLLYKDGPMAELLINDRTYKDIEIEPLEASPNSLDLEELLEGINPDSLNLEELDDLVIPEE
jgi:hypothetical protein